MMIDFVSPLDLKNPMGLYIHIPFCKSKCIYCDFCSFAGQESNFERYVHCLKTEMTLYAPKFLDRVFSTVFVGGGTPSLLGAKAIREILQHANRCFNILPDAEVSLEANPDSFNEEFAKATFDAGVNRISLGLQSASNKLLKNLGRPHTYNDFCRAYAIAQKYFDNINVDLMLGIEGQTQKELFDTLVAVTQKNPTHLSVYGLIVEKGTKLFKRVKDGKIILPTEDDTADMYDFAVEFLAQKSYCRYEISNFAKQGYECRHNLNYWNRGNYLGVGLSAHGFFEGIRYANTKRMDKYFEKTEQNVLPISTKTKVSQKDACFEFVFLNLRKTVGFDVSDFRASTGKDFFKEYGNVFYSLQQKKLLCLQNGRIFVPPQYFYVVNNILTEFAP